MQHDAKQQPQLLVSLTDFDAEEEKKKKKKGDLQCHLMSKSSV